MTPRRAVPLLLALMIAAQPAFGANLRPSVMVDGDAVRLGDLFDDVGAKADAVVARSPAPGKRITLYSNVLAGIAAAQGLDWRPASRFEQIVVERNGQIVPREQIENDLRAALFDQGVPAKAEIELNGGLEEVVVPTGTPVSIGVHDIVYEARYRRFSANVEVPASGPSSRRLHITGRVYPTLEVPVMAHAVSRGDVITARDLTFTRIREDTLRRDILTDADQLIGQAARQPLRNGQMLAVADVGKPVAVEKGALVTLILRSGAMSLSAQARANDAGSVGDTIRVTNTHSNQVVEARVDGPNRVSIPMGGALGPAN